MLYGSSDFFGEVVVVLVVGGADMGTWIGIEFVLGRPLLFIVVDGDNGDSNNDSL